MGFPHTDARLEARHDRDDDDDDSNDDVVHLFARPNRLASIERVLLLLFSKRKNVLFLSEAEAILYAGCTEKQRALISRKVSTTGENEILSSRSGERGSLVLCLLVLGPR